MKRYRQIEVTAFRRRVTIVSGGRLRDMGDAQTEQTDDGVSLNDTDSCERVEPDSVEGQLILFEAVRSLEQRLSPEARAELRGTPEPAVAHTSRFRRSLYAKLRRLSQLIVHLDPTRRT